VSETVKITIDDREYDAPAGARLIDVIQDKAGQEIPRFCYHRDLPVVGSCRMCQVEIEAPAPGGVTRRALAISCRTPVAPGMKVFTQSDPAQKARKGVLEFLLKDHPLDCPICDKAGECPLQDFTFGEGQSAGRSHDPRKKRRKRVSLGDVIVLDEERCVLCTRCVRFFPSVEGREQLQVREMGHRSMIGTYDDRPLEGGYQGNLADICPVGALTLKKFRFQARSWNLRPIPTTCTRCSRGCSVNVDAYRGRVVRIRPRYDEAVNKSWICDYGRFTFEDLNQPGRLAAVLAAGKEVPEDLGLDRGLQLAGEWLREAGSEAVLVASPYLTLEEGEAFLELARAAGAKPRFLAPEEFGGDEILRTGDPAPNRRGLAELGLEPASPAKVREALAAAPASLLAGEKVLHLLHGMDPGDHGAVFPTAKDWPRAMVLDTHPRDGFALNMPARTWMEKQGRVRNVDGVERVLRPVIPAPSGIPDGGEVLRRIAGAVQPPAAANQPGDALPAAGGPA
jgi:NADH-quinone oxidoreductase subunit G